MALLFILPSENEILARRRASHVENNGLVMHALDTDVFGYLCQRTDWSTGTVGVKSAISHARIAFDLSEDIPRKPTRNLRVVNNKAVQDSISRLIKVGLFDRHSQSLQEGANRNRLLLVRVLWREFLTARHFLKNPDVDQTLGFFSELKNNNIFNNSSLEENTAVENTSRRSSDVTNNSNYITNADTHKFRMSLTWQPDRDFVDLFLSACGFKGSEIQKVWFGKYVQYWYKEEMFKTQHEWSEHFANHMQGYLIDAGRFDRLNGVGVTPTVRNNTGSQPKRLTVPNIPDGSRLQSWAMSHGLEACPVGYDTRQYYQMLCNHVERINLDNEKRGDRVLQ